MELIPTHSAKSSSHPTCSFPETISIRPEWFISLWVWRIWRRRIVWYSVFSEQAVIIERSSDHPGKTWRDGEATPVSAQCRKCEREDCGCQSPHSKPPWVQPLSHLQGNHILPNSICWQLLTKHRQHCRKVCSPPASGQTDAYSGSNRDVNYTAGSIFKKNA